jgi:hypothetical protein
MASTSISVRSPCWMRMRSEREIMLDILEHKPSRREVAQAV